MLKEEYDKANNQAAKKMIIRLEKSMYDGGVRPGEVDNEKISSIINNWMKLAEANVIAREVYVKYGHLVENIMKYIDTLMIQLMTRASEK